MTYNSVDTITDNTLPQILNNFLVYLKTQKGRSQKTIDAYKKDLRMMFRFLKASKLNLDEIDLKNINILDIDDNFIKNIQYTDLCLFINFLEQKNNSAKTRARKIAVIKTFYSYLQNQIELITIGENISLKLETPKIGSREPIYLTPEESFRLLDCIKEDTNYKRDKCIVTLLLNTGLRVSELSNINLSDIKGDLLTVVGKGNKGRTICLNQMCLDSIKDYIWLRDLYKNYLIDEDSKNALFISKRYARLQTKGIEGLIHKWANKAILSEKITPHKLRHTACTLMIKSGIDIRTVQEIVGHSNISTTQLYTHIDMDDKRKAAENILLNRK